MRLTWAVVLVLALLPTGSRAICGDGRLDSRVGANDTCVSADNHNAESCDINQSASFGMSAGGCGDDCIFDHTAELFLEAPMDPADDKHKEWGFTTFAMQGKDQIVYDSTREMVIDHDHLAPCLYTPRDSDMGYRNCTDTTLTDASTKYALLRNCYDTNISSTTFGQRKAEDEASMVADGHKCPYPVTIRTKPAGGVQLWDTNDVNATHNYDVCFTLTDPQWPYVNEATNQFVPSSTRISYQVICDPLIQNESFEDCDNSTVACTRLGGVTNPCGHMGSGINDFFELVVCDGSDDECQTLEVTNEDDNVRAYDFAIDPLATENKLGCSVLLLNNSMLQENQILHGDLPLYKDYIGQNGATND